MLFNSLEFLIYFPIVFVLYWLFHKSFKTQNVLIFLASYFFYGWWDWRFTSLILFSSIADYTLAQLIYNSSDLKQRKGYLIASLVINLGILAFFKYFNFFLTEVSSLIELIGFNAHLSTLSIILPFGISFYTFQTLSYTIDVYKKQMVPTKDFIAFSAYVSFFPQLVAGPIERAQALLPQFLKKRKFDYEQAVVGSQQVLLGFFKKIVIADNCALFVNDIFGYSNYGEVSGLLLIIGAVLFGIQIYADFSGYSDIAIGIARFFGFNLMQNFAFPYFSRDIAEFWRRWHISLTTWFRDYLYIPLGGSRGGTGMKIRNTFIIFLVSGFWHGANWTYIVWGFLNACYFLPLLLAKQNRKNLDIVAQNRILPSIKEIFQMGSTFFITSIAWIFFRAESLSDAFAYIGSIFKNLFLIDSRQFLGRVVFQAYEINADKGIILFISILLLLFLEWINRRNAFGLYRRFKYSPANWIFYYLIIFMIIFYGQFNQTEFIYFQF